MASVDALRGLTVAAMLLVNDAGDWSHVHPWLAHAGWHGVAPPDYVFPFFLFIVGVSISLALTPRVTVLLGMRAGDLLRAGRDGPLIVGGVLALSLGALWSLVLPFNKQLWTSSYVLWTGGWVMLALALAHLAIDRARWPALGRSLGINAIAAYAGAWIAACVLDATGAQRSLYDTLFANRFEPWVASAAYAAAFTAVWWAAMALCARRGWRFTI